MSPLIIISLSTFLATSLVVWAIIERCGGLAGRGERRLRELRSIPAPPDGWITSPQTELERYLSLASRLAPRMLRPRSEMQRASVKLRLARAGIQAGDAVSLYVAMRFLSIVVGAVSAFVVWLSLYGVFNWLAGSAAALILCAGLMVPDTVLNFRAKARKNSILRSLPEFVDLMVVAIEVGQGLDAAMYTVAEEMSSVAPALCAELGTYNSQLHMGMARRDALHELGIRSDVTELNSFASILIQVDKYGSSVAQALRQQSDVMRVRRRNRAEERAQQAAVKLILPLVLFIFPGIFTVLVGPAAISVMRDFNSL